MNNLSLADGLVAYLEKEGSIKPSVISERQQLMIAKYCKNFPSIPSIGMQLRKLHQAGRVEREWDKTNKKLKVYKPISKPELEEIPMFNGTRKMLKQLSLLFKK